MQSFDKFVGFAAAGFCAAMLLGCQGPTSGSGAALDPPPGAGQYAAAVVAAPHPPPPSRAEIPPPARFPGSLWQFGHWHWNGAQFVWVSGRYIERPAPTANWMPGYWEEQGSGWVWTDGRWSS